VIKLGTFLVWWGPASVVIGAVCCHIPWGSPGRLHGKGLPIPAVIWDRPTGSAQFLDYPNPWAYLLNPLILLIAGLICYGLYRWIRSATSREPSNC
jgi:hypothetical protein